MKNKICFAIQKKVGKIMKKTLLLNLIIIQLLLNIINSNLIPLRKTRNLDNYNSEIHLISAGEEDYKHISYPYEVNKPIEVIADKTGSYSYDYSCGSYYYRITLKFNTRFNSTKNLFKDLTCTTEIDLSKFDFSEVTDMSYMFYGCKILKNITFGNINTIEVKSLNSLFRGCSKLLSMDLSNFDFSKVTDMSYMFYGCSKLITPSFGDIKTSSLKIINNIFNGCSNLQSIDLSKFDFSKVTDISYMFSECTSLISINLGITTTTSFSNINNLFYNCKSLKSVDLSKFSFSSYASKIKYICWMLFITNKFKFC